MVESASSEERSAGEPEDGARQGESLVRGPTPRPADDDTRRLDPERDRVETVSMVESASSEERSAGKPELGPAPPRLAGRSPIPPGFRVGERVVEGVLYGQRVADVRDAVPTEGESLVRGPTPRLPDDDTKRLDPVLGATLLMGGRREGRTDQPEARAVAGIDRGARIETDAKYCSQCGASLAPDDRRSPPPQRPLR